jgi:translation initiation factor 2D
LKVLSHLPRLKEEEVDVILNKNQFTRIVLASKTIIYAVGDIPYFYDVAGRNNIYPTLFTLWRFPHALRCFVIHAPVSEYVMKGADLMLPGLCTIAGK